MNAWPAVFFGGTLRSLLISRITKDVPGRPRDIDIVLSVNSVNDVERQFQEWVSRKTRYGGIGLWRRGWQFDLWPVTETFAFKQTRCLEPGFEELPKTTFLNAEAIAIDVWTQPGKPRKIYSGDDQFFHGVLTATLDVNQIDNPFPELSVLRALVMANHLRWKIAPRLAAFITTHGTRISPVDLIEIQKHHYNVVRLPWTNYKAMLNMILKSVDNDPARPVALRFERQIGLWSDFDERYSVEPLIRLTNTSRKPRKHKQVRTNLSLLEAL